ncbi:Ubiquitin- modifier 1 [Ptychographa xylographoides]|nr:Ubiquitin- modifier 1 [Ptychographa xylographoides]
MDQPVAIPQQTIAITVEFTGGLEMLFSNQRKHSLHVPTESEAGVSSNLAFLIDYLCRHVMKSSKTDMFVIDGSIRPGILVLINDADWELEGEEQYELQQQDNVLFVSTLHGG